MAGISSRVRACRGSARARAHRRVFGPVMTLLVPDFVGGLIPQGLLLRVPAEGARARWGVDDVYVDPFRQR